MMGRAYRLQEDAGQSQCESIGSSRLDAATPRRGECALGTGVELVASVPGMREPRQVQREENDRGHSPNDPLDLIDALLLANSSWTHGDSPDAARPGSSERPEDPRWREAIGRKCGCYGTLNRALILGAD